MAEKVRRPTPHYFGRVRQAHPCRGGTYLYDHMSSLRSTVSRRGLKSLYKFIDIHSTWSDLLRMPVTIP